MNKLAIAIVSTAMYMNAAAADKASGKPAPPTIEKLDLTAEQAKRMKAV